MRTLLLVPPGGPVAWDCGADGLIMDRADAALAPPGAPPIYTLNGATKGAYGVALEGAEGGADVQRLGARLAVEEARLGLPDGSLRILAFAADSPEAVQALSAYRGCSARLDGLIWREAPLSGKLRGGPLRLARDLLLIAARAAGVSAFKVASPSLDLAQAKADGFDGIVALGAEQVKAIRSALDAG